MAKHMTQDDRKVLEARYNAGQSVAGIARAATLERWMPMVAQDIVQSLGSSAYTMQSSGSGIGRIARRSKVWEKCSS